MTSIRDRRGLPAADLGPHPDVSDIPNSFLWGTGSSAIQVEGSRRSRGENIWDRFAADGHIADRSNPGIAADHLALMEVDVDLLHQLGVGAYRFSTAWSRVVPDGIGKISEQGLDEYDRLVDLLLEADIEPFITLYHWDLPQPLQDRGGWLNRDTIDAFINYTGAVTARLGDRVTSWATINKPQVVARQGYVDGSHAPGLTGDANFAPVAHHLLLAHATARPIIRAHSPGAEVGLIADYTPIRPASTSDEAEVACALTHALCNQWFLEPIFGKGYPETPTEALDWDGREILPGDMDTISRSADFLGVNYYGPQIDKLTSNAAPRTGDHPRTATGRMIDPDALLSALQELRNNYVIPQIYITENGAAFDDQVDGDGRVVDQNRIEFLASHIDVVAKARRAGIPIGGYFVNKFLDGFEWEHGFDYKIGLVTVDPESHRRYPKASFDWYRSLIASTR